MRIPSRLWLIVSLFGFGALSIAFPYARSSFAGSQRQASDATPAATSAAGENDSGALNTAQPPVPVDEIIRRFAQHESDFKIARGQYTYTQDVSLKEAEPDGGEYHIISDIIFDPQGRRFENVTYAPQNTLQHILLTPEDQKDIEDIQPFVLTTEDLPKYDVEYVGAERIDELNTYVFRVSPKKIDKKQRYFEGTVWVDDHDFAVVKTYGKAVPDLDQQFPHFTTYRENIEANFWFPTYTHADDILRFKTEDVHILLTIRYKNYKRFGSTIRLGQSRTVGGAPTAQQSPQK